MDAQPFSDGDPAPVGAFLGRLRTPEPGFGACARQAGAVGATRGLSPRDALVEDVLGLGLGQWIGAGGLGPGIHDFAAIDRARPGRRIAGRSGRWRTRRFADVRQDRLDRGRIRDERDDSHLARALRTGQRERFIDAREQDGPQVTGLAAPVRLLGRRFTSRRRQRLMGPFRTQRCSLCILLERQRRHGWAQRRIRREHPVVTQPVAPRWRHQRGHALDEFGR